MIAAVLCVCMVLPLCACSSDKPEQKQIFAMDTVMTLTAYGKYAGEGINAGSRRDKRHGRYARSR